MKFPKQILYLKLGLNKAGMFEFSDREAVGEV